MSDFLITGGAGFIGANFLEMMTERYPSDNFTCLDALTYAGNEDNLCSVRGKHNFAFVRGDICDKRKVEELFSAEKFDCVVNFAAESHVDRSIADPSAFFRTNVLGVQTLLDACVKYGVKRFHQISTDEVYGDLSFDGAEPAFTESSALKPSSPYSASKASADLIALSYFRTYGLPVSVSRCSNNYGKYQHSEKLIPLVISRAVSGREIPVYGTGRNVRDWIAVSDHCEAVDRIVREGKGGEVYNVGARCERSNLSLVKEILRKLGREESLIRFVADRAGHDRRYAIDPEKAQLELGWSAKKSFDEGLDETIGWYLSHRERLSGDGYGKI